jgi:hypothetical protein
MASDSFASSRQRVARAQAHIRYLDTLVKAFIRRKPYKHVIQPHPDGIHEIHKLKARRRHLPRSFVDVSTDAIENLRAALDHAAYTIAIAHRITNPKILKSIAFPFGANHVAFTVRMRNCCPGFPKEILTLLESFKPYYGGDNILWAINELANTSKHKTLTTVAFRITEAYTHEIRGMGNMQFPPQWDRANNEFVLGMVKRKAHVTYNVSLAFNVGLDDIPSIAGNPICGALNAITRKIDYIVTELELEARRIGLPL